MEALKNLKKELNNIRSMLSNRLDEAKKEEVSKDEKGSKKEEEFFKKLDDETIEAFADSLLSTVAEFQASGKIPEFENANDVRDALLAVARKLYQDRATLAKMARKYERFGSSRILRMAKADISKAMQ